MHIDMKHTCLSKNLQAFADSIKVLAEPNRLKIVCLLKKHPLCVCEIFEALGLPQNLTSHHLKTLLDANILNNKREGKKIIYSLNRNRIQRLQNELESILSL